MIVTDKTLDVEPAPSEAPPSYEASGSTLPVPLASYDSKRRTPPASPLAISPAASSSGSRSPAAAPSWFNFASPTTRQVRATVLGLVKDLVKLPQSDQTSVAINILKSCADACAANGLSISTILQEKSVEGHTPIYWAIIKRPAEPLEEDSAAADLLTTLLSLSSPLTPATTSDVRLACLLTSDQALFQRLRSSPEFAPPNATDEILLDVTLPPDEISVQNVSGEAGQEGAFVVDFSIVRFQKRLLIGKCIVLEFIARARMWRLSFNVAQPDRNRNIPSPGTWYVALSLLENSPPTWIDSRLLVPAPPEAPQEQPGGFASVFGGGRPRPRPTLSVRIKAQEQLEASGRRHRRNEIIVLLDGNESDGGMGGLQYA
ncbi:hypothetical protein C8J57DRAFT_1105480 [Mycena rebaudengoi]|nr:hypothetical protein C8J57DRAFT_1105480 [Mycena rebaudengoi]